MGLPLSLRQEGMLRLPRSRADKEPQLAPRALCSHVDHRLVMSLRVAALGPSRPGHGVAAGQLKWGGSSQATEALITEAEQGQPCGNCVQLTDGTGGGGAPAGGFLCTEASQKLVTFCFTCKRVSKLAPHLLFNWNNV